MKPTIMHHHQRGAEEEGLVGDPRDDLAAGDQQPRPGSSRRVSWRGPAALFGGRSGGEGSWGAHAVASR